MQQREQANSVRNRQPWGLTVGLLSIVSAVAVGVPFLPQPLLELMRADYHVSLSSIGSVATAAQVGAAVGILLLVPLADVLRPYIHLTVQLSACALALALAAWAPNVLGLCLAIAAGALCSVAAQIILPIALREAPEGKRARTAATLGASLLFGIFGSRLIAGVLGAQIGWRATLLLYAGLVLLTVIGAWIALRPAEAPTAELSYAGLLLSVPRIASRDARLVLSSIAQGLSFAAFNAQWSVIASHLMLMDNPWTATQVGLVNVVGLGAGVLAVSAGPIVARIGPSGVLRRVLPLLIIAAVIIAYFHVWLGLSLIALLVLSTANQISHVANQTEALFHHQATGGRANAVYMFGTMLGGGLGAAVGTVLYPATGLFGVAIFGAAAGVVSLAVVMLRDRVQQLR